MKAHKAMKCAQINVKYSMYGPHKKVVLYMW